MAYASVFSTWRSCACLFMTLSLASIAELTFALPAKQESLLSCLTSEGIHVAAQGSAEWKLDTDPFNRRWSWTPAAVAVPISTAQIQSSVSCGIKCGVRISARSGGHGFGAFDLGGEDGHLVIALDQMYNVTVDDDNVATVQAGSRLGHLATELFQQKGRAIAHGECPNVGIGGHALHGGYGMMSRFHGLTLDWLVGATVVLANASVVHCSDTEHPDLFWALRGAGSSFGIVAEFEFNTFKAPDVTQAFRIDMSWNATQAVQGIRAFQNFVLEAPKEMAALLFLSPRQQRIDGAYFGSRSDLDQLVYPFLHEIGRDGLSDVRSLGWLDAQSHFSEHLNQKQSRNATLHLYFYATSLFTGALTDVQIVSLVDTMFPVLMNQSAPRNWYFLLEAHGGPASAVSAVGVDETAFAHRDKGLLYQFEIGQGPPRPFPLQNGISLMEGFKNSITDHMEAGEWGMYANYLDAELDAETAQHMYWADNLPRLRAVKSELDPDEVFWNPQGVRPWA